MTTRKAIVIGRHGNILAKVGGMIIVYTRSVLPMPRSLTVPMRNKQVVLMLTSLDDPGRAYAAPKAWTILVGPMTTKLDNHGLANKL